MTPTEVFSVWFIVKLLFITAFVVYGIFAAVVVRQVYLMTQTLEVGLETTIRTLSWAHFIFALAILVLSVLLL